MIRRPPRSTPLYSSAASDVYKRQAHEVAGACVRLCEKRGKELHEMTPDEMTGIHEALNEGVLEVLTVEGSLAARDGAGGTAPARVIEQGKAARARVKHFRPWAGV